MADNSTKIAQIQALLQSGATSVTVDGVTTTFDHASMRKELRELMAKDDVHAGRKPPVRSIYLGGW